jgi:hypothetical protein
MGTQMGGIFLAVFFTYGEIMGLHGELLGNKGREITNNFKYWQVFVNHLMHDQYVDKKTCIIGSTNIRLPTQG